MLRGRLLVAAVTLLSAMLLLVACEDAPDTIDETRDQADDTAELVRFCAAALQLGDAVRQQDVETAVDAAETAAEHAPDDIADDAQRAHEGAQRLADGDQSVLEDEEFRASVEAVSTYAREECDPTD